MLCDGFNDNYIISIISHSGDYRDAHALIGQVLHHILLYNHSVQGDYNKSTKFQNGCFACILSSVAREC